uniref:[histone H3]-lysine(4) N-methyltransferase n=1 Tax=Callorhinchus milii TaxID=7868 RepID=A0A4W3HIQ9_CALMI
QSSDAPSDSSSALSPPTKPDVKPAIKDKKADVTGGEKRRGRPPTLSNPKLQLSQDKKEPANGKSEKPKKEKEKKVKKKPSSLLQQATKIKKLRAVKLSPLQSRLKNAKLQINSKGGKIERRRGRPPSSERLKTVPKLLVSPQPKKQKRPRKEKDTTPSPKLAVTKDMKSVDRRRPQRLTKPVRVVPVTKRTDATIAKQLLQRAKKGAQKRMEKEAAKLQESKGRPKMASPQLKNIRQFIMPVVRAFSSRVIKPPKRFIEDDSYIPPIKPTSSSPPPPLLSPPPPLQPTSNLSDHSPWLLPPRIPLATPFIAPAPLPEKRKSILREPTFKWTSLKNLRPESQYFSSAKYAKEGLIPRLFSSSPLLRAPRFTPSEAHSRIFESVTVPSPTVNLSSSVASSRKGHSSRKKKKEVHIVSRIDPKSPSHSMRTRSGRLISTDLSSITPQTSVASSPPVHGSLQHSVITSILSSGPLKHSAPAISSMLTQADKMPTTDKRVANLLRRAKAQLCKIEKSKSLKVTDPTKSQVMSVWNGQESDSSETSIRGPRIKHVCRRAAVALGRKRAVFPDDMPTLSALPWEEREKILSSMGNDDKSSVAGSEDAEPPQPVIKPIAKHKVPQEPIVRKGRRSRRCGQCPGCQVPDDCGQCTNCLDKPKFGGRNVKKQCLVPVSKVEPSTLNLLTTFTNVSSGKQKALADGVHRIRVDFKEDCAVENVWEMGGLSILTSVPITPRVVCFLCASSGHVEFVYCQVCCEPFHLFCLEESERPLEEQWENWCCRRCKFCHVCCRQNKSSKQLLECGKCRNSYHPECLGPNYPTKPTKKKKVWICTKCVRCKSCGATTPGKGWDAQWSHDFSLCHECAKLFDKGNFCPLCDKCYDDDDYESKMMQCGKCERWVHAKCESLSDEMYEILSNLPESVAYTCINCTEQHPAEWRLALGKELQTSLKQVLTALLNSRTTSHLLRYRQVSLSTISNARIIIIKSCLLYFSSGMLPNAVLPPSSDHNYAQWQERDDGNRTEQPALTKKIIPAPRPKALGDPDSPDAGRLLYIGQNEWTHMNCALWSAEVFEDDDGSLKNVHMAVIRGKQLRCERCQKSGATVGCCLTSCQSNYHFMCARAKNCVFLDDKKVYCQKHKDLVKGETVPEDGFEVLRRVYVDFEDITLRRKFLTGLEPESIHMMIGSMTIDCLGILNDLSDCEAKLFPIGYQCSRVYWSTTDARKRCVYTCKILEHRPPPIETEENRTLEHTENRTTVHSPSSIAGTESGSFDTGAAETLEHHLSSHAPGPIPPRPLSGSRIQISSFPPLRRSPGTSSRPLPSPGNRCRSVSSSYLLPETRSSVVRASERAWVRFPSRNPRQVSLLHAYARRCLPSKAWKVLTDKVQEARSNARLKHISFSGVNGLKMLGISHDAVVFLIEQLYGAKRCKNYSFKFHKHQEVDELPLNPHGSARAEIHQRKSAFDMFNFLASKHRQPPDYNPNEEEEEEVQLKSARRATSMDLPMAMRFRHLKKTSKEAVGVYRSPIHGRGLFCKRNIDAGEMVIEYSGNVIRSVLTDKREKYYDSKGIGCYMFRIDDYEVVDATMHGNAARFINHACEPNCFSRVINVDGQKHIVIFAVRKIYRGEELTYDYKFPIEDASNKLSCNCGAKKCRKFLN